MRLSYSGASKLHLRIRRSLVKPGDFKRLLTFEEFAEYNGIDVGLLILTIDANRKPQSH